MQKDFGQLYDAFVTVIKEKDELQVKRFLANHFTEFPDTIQEDITLILLSDALGTAIAQREHIASGLQELGEIEKLERKLDDHRKALELSQK